MANPQRGDVALTVGDRAFTLVLDFDAMCQLETLLSTPDRLVTAGEALLNALRLSHVHSRALLYAATRRNHKELSLVQCGDLIEEIGGVEKFLVTVLAIKDTAEPDKEDQTDRPQDARQTDGTGAPTTSKPVALALVGTGSGV